MQYTKLFAGLILAFISCKQAPTPDPVTSKVSTPSGFSDTTNYATHPLNDLEVIPFMERYHKAPKSDVMLIDLRTPPEFDDGYIPGAVMINYLENDIDQQLSLLDKNKTYFIYCLQGARSSKCLDKMAAMGFTKVYNMIGGYELYLKSGVK